MNIKKLTLTAFFVAIAVAGSLFSFPVLGSRCSPIQHLVNVMCAILLGPWYGLAAAFLAALIRNILGLGTLLAFPGSMCGALLSGLLYKWMKKLPAAYIGEVVGTGIIGGMLSYPIAGKLLGRQGRKRGGHHSHRKLLQRYNRHAPPQGDRKSTRLNSSHRT